MKLLPACSYDIPGTNTNQSETETNGNRYLYVFERPCCGACDLLCFSCTGRSRAFHKTRGSAKWTAPADNDDDINDNNDKDNNNNASGIDGNSNNSGNGNGDSGTFSREVNLAGGVRQGSGSGGGGSGGGGSGGSGSRGNGGGGGGEGRGGGVANRGAQGVLSSRGDNWLGTHEAALLRVAGLHPGCEMVDAQFTSGMAATPYCLLVDHDWRCVVVSIRGTMSLDDCLCDLQAQPESMEESGKRWGFDGSDMLAHQVRSVEREGGWAGGGGGGRGGEGGLS